MNILLSVVAFIVIFSVLILVHEFGHFIMAKRAGIKVEEFGLGLPPRIWGKKKGETIYSLNWIPFGGFVRLFGEDSTDPKMMRSSRSFAGKPMRARVKVIVAGVVMNFFLAWLLMVVGFTVGMQPLLGPDDVLEAVRNEQVVLAPGLKVKSVEEGGFAAGIGLAADDNVIAVNGESVNDYNLAEIVDDPNDVVKIVRGGEVVELKATAEQLEAAGEDSVFGAEFYDFAPFPRVKIYDLPNHSAAYRSGLRADDVVLSVNGQQVFDIVDFEAIAREANTLEYVVYRDGFVEEFIVERGQARQVIVAKVLPGGPAAEEGFEEGDVVISINGRSMSDSLEVIRFVEEQGNVQLAYLIDRNGQRIFKEVTPRDGKIGVYLSELINYDVDTGMSLYNVDLLSSVIEIKDEQYPFYIAAYKAIGETYRLSKLTVNMFLGFVANLVRYGEVPDSVAGPVGIAQMTHVFVQEGFIPLIRFVAILSLSLAVINILPFPALDGGRLLFIIIEFIIGRRVNQRWEAWIHGIGYLLILLLILAVTYSDIMRLIGL